MIKTNLEEEDGRHYTGKSLLTHDRIAAKNGFNLLVDENSFKELDRHVCDCGNGGWGGIIRVSRK